MTRALITACRKFRHCLHAQPRISNNEADTAKALIQFLDQHAQLQPTHTNVGGGAGVVFQIRGGKERDCSHSVLLRADMDALPLVESGTTNIKHISQVQGAHHACGHDGHTAMLAGALVQLKSMASSFSGTVIAVFQPAEETGDGAKQMIDAAPDLLSKTITRGAYALHNIPGEPLGKVVLRSGAGARLTIYKLIDQLNQQTLHTGHRVASAFD